MSHTVLQGPCARAQGAARTELAPTCLHHRGANSPAGCAQPPVSPAGPGVLCAARAPEGRGRGPSDSMPGAGTHKTLGNDLTGQVKTHLSMKSLATWGEGRANQGCCLLRVVTVSGVMGSRAESQTRLSHGHPPCGALLWVQGEPDSPGGPPVSPLRNIKGVGVSATT